MNPLILSDKDAELPRAVEDILELGGVLIFPTDTLYGIGGNTWDEQAIARVQRMKQRLPGQPFALLLPVIEAIERVARLDERTRTIIERFLPGPYTFLLAAAEHAPRAAVKDRKVGIRVPDHPFFGSVMRSVDRPLFGTSVNRSGEPPLENIDAIIEHFSNVDLIVTGTTTPSGIASALIDLTVDPPQAIRGNLPDALRHPEERQP
jgi:L-threonylcarbamoyladenylate synthase